MFDFEFISLRSICALLSNPKSNIRNPKSNRTFALHLTLFAAVSMMVWENIIHYSIIVIQQ